MIFNLDSRRYLARSPRVMLRPFERARGMIGYDFARTDFDAMVFPDCRAIHTWFMSCRIDVVFLDQDQQVKAVFKKLPPWKTLVRVRGAATVVELPAGTIVESGTGIGHRLNLNATLTPEAIEEYSRARLLRTGVNILTEGSPE